MVIFLSRSSVSWTTRSTISLSRMGRRGPGHAALRTRIREELGPTSNLSQTCTRHPPSAPSDNQGYRHPPRSPTKRRKNNAGWDSHNLIDRWGQGSVGPPEAFKLRKWIEENATWSRFSWRISWSSKKRHLSLEQLLTTTMRTTLQPSD